MRAPFLKWCRTGSYLLGAAFFIWLGYWIQEHFVVQDGILDKNVLLLFRETPYKSRYCPLWCANLIAGGILCCTLFLIMPVTRMFRLQWFHTTIFCLLLLICVLPIQLQFDVGGVKHETLLTRLSYRIILSSLGVVLCLRGLVCMPKLVRLHAILDRFFLWLSIIPRRMFLVGSFISCFVICGFISWFVFDGVPGFVDSCAYMFQARLFAHGMLYAPPPTEPQFFEALHTILSNKWYTVYPPGYPAVLALGVLFKVSWLVNPFLGALTIVCIYLLAKELYGNGIAKISVVITCVSGFFLFMSSEFASHTSTLFFITLAFLSFVWMVKKKRPLLSAIVCGICLGIAFLCRPYTTFWICVPMGIAALIARKKLSLRHILIGAIPLLFACLAFCAYNYATTGHPLVLGYIQMHGKNHYPGFHQEPWGTREHTVKRGFKYVFENLNALDYYLFEWPIPALLFVCVFLAYGKKGFWEWLLLGWMVTLFVGHFFYFFNQLDFGPRFVYECLPALIIFTSQGLALSVQSISSQWRTMSYADARNNLSLMLIGLFLFAFLFNMPSTVKTYQKYGKDVTIQKYLKKNDVPKALVFVKGYRAQQVHYPLNVPFAKPHIYAKNKGDKNIILAERFPGYRYFMADEEKVVEVSIDELQQYGR